MTQQFLPPILLALVALTCTTVARAQDGEVRQYRPVKVGVGSLLVKGVNRFRQPQIYEIALNPHAVQEALPQPIEPRLKRPAESFFDRIGALFRTRLFIRTINDVLRRVEGPTGISTREQLKEYFREHETHTYAITGEAFAFAPTGPQFGKDLVSKHAMIAEDYLDVRFAGQLWREGDTLCFNSNSGTYMKKRRSSGLPPAPEHTAAQKIFAAIFEPALKIKYCREIAPWFGADEAIDQAQKAIAAADDAEWWATRLSTPDLQAAEARQLAQEARVEAGKTYDAATAASSAEASYLRNLEDETARKAYFSADRRAADAADRVQVFRDKIEDLVESD